MAPPSVQRRPGCLRLGGWVLAVLLNPSHVALAQPLDGAHQVRAHLELVAPPSCATLGGLVARVAVRSRRIEFVNDGAPMTSLHAVIQPENDQRTRASLTMVDPEGRRSVRLVETRTCEEAADALALIVVVSLDPSAAFTAEPPKEPEKAAPKQVAAPASPASIPRPSRRRQFWGAAGVAFEGVYGPAPELMPGGSLYARLIWDRASVWSPMLRVIVSHFEREGFEVAGGTAGFSSDELTLELCPLSIGRGRVSVSYCAMGSGGWLRARGSDTPAPETRTRPWWVAGASAVLSLRPTAVLEIAANLRVGAPLVRDSFEFGSSGVFHRASVLTYTGALGVGLALP